MSPDRRRSNATGELAVKTGRLSPHLGRIVSRLQRDREDADYQTGAVFTEQEADEAIADASTFVDAAKTVLA